MSNFEKKIVIYGCGGHARSIINSILKKRNRDSIIVVDGNAKENERILGCMVSKTYELDSDDSYIVGVGDNRNREKLFLEILKQSEKALTVISPSADIGEETCIGKGTFVAANAYVGPCCKIGVNTIINTGSVVEHETVIGNHTHVAVNATICGRCVIGDNVFCGAGSTVVDQIKICDNVVVGAGSVVISDITEPGTYVGVPAKKVGRK